MKYLKKFNESNDFDIAELRETLEDCFLEFCDIYFDNIDNCMTIQKGDFIYTNGEHNPPVWAPGIIGALISWNRNKNNSKEEDAYDDYLIDINPSVIKAFQVSFVKRDSFQDGFSNPEKMTILFNKSIENFIRKCSDLLHLNIEAYRPAKIESSHWQVQFTFMLPETICRLNQLL